MCDKCMRKSGSALQLTCLQQINKYLKKGPLKILTIEETHSF